LHRASYVRVLLPYIRQLRHYDLWNIYLVCLRWANWRRCNVVIHWQSMCQRISIVIHRLLLIVLKIPWPRPWPRLS